MSERESDSVLGITALPFFLGNDVHGDAIHRRAAIVRADFCFGWLHEANTTWWADALFAVSRDRRVFLAGEGHLHSQFGILGGGNRDYVMLDCCKDKSQAVTVARTIASHDPKREVNWLAFAYRLSDWLDKCESPAEARLAVHMAGHDLDWNSDIEPQVSACGFRIDFAAAGDDESFKLAIEVDGHEWHERTKEQAQRDKSRDRRLVENGWRVIRFTGSEIWKDPHRCAGEVCSLLETLSSGMEDKS